MGGQRPDASTPKAKGPSRRLPIDGLLSGCAPHFTGTLPSLCPPPHSTAGPPPFCPARRAAGPPKKPVLSSGDAGMMTAARGRSGRGPRAGGRGGEGAPRRGVRGDRRKQQLSSKRQQHQLRQKHGGSLPRRPDIKGLEGGEKNKLCKKSKPKSSSGSSSSSSSTRPRKEEQQQQQRKQRAGSLERREAGSRPEKSIPKGPRQKRKLSHGQERLRALLSKHPELLHAGESADAAVAACFKKAAGGPNQGGPHQQPEGSSGAPSPSDNRQQQQQVSGSKRRKLLRLVMSSRTAEEKVFVHKAYQLYNEILRSTRASEGGGGRSSHRPNSRLQSLVGKALGAALPRRHPCGIPPLLHDKHICTARLAQVCLKHSEGVLRLKLWELLFKDFTEFCCCKSFYHVAMKLHLYASEQQRERLVEKLVSRKEAAFTRHGATVWEYIYSAQKTAVAQQKLLNCLMLEPAVLVAVPQANQCTSFAQVVKLLSEAQQKKVLENVSGLIQKCVDKELLGKAHVHRIVKALCRQESAACVAEPQQLSATWSTVAEGALHLATTKDGVEGLVCLLGYASAKERKNVVKGLKQHCLAFALNPVDCPVLLRLLLTVDDTKLLSEHILKAGLGALHALRELLPAAVQLAFDAYGHLLLLQLLHAEGICKQLPTHYQRLLSLPSPTSLKAAATRQAELRPAVLKAVTSAFAALPLEQTEGEEQQPSFSALLKDAFASRVLVQLAQHQEAEAALLRGLACVESDLQQEEPSLISHPVGQRALCGALKAGCRGAPSILAAAWGPLAKRLSLVLETKGVFVILQLFNSARELQLFELEAQTCSTPSRFALPYYREKATHAVEAERASFKTSAVFVMRKQLDEKALAQAEAAAQKAGKCRGPSHRHSASARGSGG
ncbi:hypothetical protein Esti_001107 [Eimeria stiedai]